MTNLESLARGMYERYSYREFGYKASWERLNKARKIEWLKEALLLSEYVIDELKEEYGKKLEERKAHTSYQDGYNRGIMEERNRVINFINDLTENFNGDLTEFVEGD